MCREAYPAQDGGICRACQGEPLYLTEGCQEETGTEARRCKSLPAEQAVGRRALHDMTMIVPGASKGPAFEKGQVIGVGDLCRLQQMGRRHLYVLEDNQVGPEWVHEDEAALAFARALAGDGVTFTEPPREGKVNLLAARDGLLVVDEARLESFNLVPGVMCACRQGFTLLTQGRVLGATRAIPLFLPRADFQKALALLSDGPVVPGAAPAPAPGRHPGHRHRGLHGAGGGQVRPHHHHQGGEIRRPGAQIPDCAG